MMADSENCRWLLGALPLAALCWHVVNTLMTARPDNLLYVCYWSNLALGVGMLFRSSLLVGAGYGWIVIALPLWLYESSVHNDMSLNNAAFHLSGLFAGAMIFGKFRMPRHTWIAALAMALVLHVAARIFTEPALNVNAAFRVYDGWEGVFSTYEESVAAMLVVFGAVFFFMTKLNNRYYMLSGAAR